MNSTTYIFLDLIKLQFTIYILKIFYDLFLFCHAKKSTNFGIKALRF